MPLNIGVVGLDHWYTAFAVIDTAQKSNAVNLLGVVELRSERLTLAQERYPNLTVTGNADSLLTDPTIELIAICAATADAPQLAMAALQNGKHVLCVKPSARTVADLDAVIAVAEENGKWFGSFEGMQRLQPRTQLLRELIRGGAIGTPMSYHQIGHGGLPSPWPGQNGMSWWRDANLVPGGAWIDHAIYAVDLSRFVFEGEVTFATGLIEKRLHKQEALEDYGVALLQLTPHNGHPSVSLLIEDTWAAESGGGYHQQLFIGTKGSLRPDGKDWVVTAGGTETRHPIPDAPFFDWEMLIPMVAGTTAPLFGPDDAQANLAACLSVYEAVAERH
jgi:predicted dehydrogenase